MSDAAVRPMRWWDIADVSAIEESTFPDDSWTVEQFWQELAQETRHYVVAIGQGQVVGYAGAFVLPPDSDVQTISVRADQQGRGVGALLLRDLMSTARVAGCTHMMLEVRAPNEAAIGLYEGHGFAAISTRRRYYPNGDDALIMRADLREAT
jgi:ribosomal-protein-alanine N-acetyltransferase